jgi:penicillin-insensitive murein endopeptidase
MSVGRPNAGALVGAVPMPEGPAWEIVSPAGAWGTKETVDALVHCIQIVNARFPDSPKAYIGHLSGRRGGPLRPHVSHQSGRDVDVSYYLRGDAHRWYATATEGSLDLDRTWTFVRALVTDTDVEYVFMDRSVQTLLRDHALRIGEDPGFVDSVFQVGGKSVRPIFFHAKGHATHLHVRFYNPAAQELGRRAYPLLLRRGIVQPPTWFVTHTVKPGETLSHIALRYKTTVEALLKPNHLTETSILKINSVVRIPMKGGIAAAPRLALPARRTPRGPAPSPTATGE